MLKIGARSAAVVLACAMWISAGTAWAQKQELGLTLGEHLSVDRTSPAGIRFTLGSDVALQANYAHRVIEGRRVSLYLGVHFLASQLRQVSTGPVGAFSFVGSPSPAVVLAGSPTRDVATIYITPGLTVKFFPKARVTPWATIGGGVAVYEQSHFVIGGGPNPATRDISHGAFMFGGGVDVPIWRFVALRGEIRDFYTGSPSYNVPITGGQNNVVAGGGIVLRFGQ